ncbi:hypothetical protein DFH11DRAFT_1619645 [Phellopilus nigrolimitatus]|nr:hypothetical protein DFH11DRAFT_1619645 [Phellopilus nigrolimitatus]
MPKSDTNSLATLVLVVAVLMCAFVREGAPASLRGFFSRRVSALGLHVRCAKFGTVPFALHTRKTARGRGRCTLRVPEGGASSDSVRAMWVCGRWNSWMGGVVVKAMGVGWISSDASGRRQSNMTETSRWEVGNIGNTVSSLLFAQFQVTVVQRYFCTTRRDV